MATRDLPGPAYVQRQKLIRSIRNGRLAVMLGPDAVTVTTPGTRVRTPVLDALRDFLADEWEEKHSEDLRMFPTSAVAEVIERRTNRQNLLELVGIFYDEYADLRGDPTLDALKQLGVGLVVNTVPGLPVEQVLEPEFTVMAYHHGADAAQFPTEWQPETARDRPLLYHLSGSFERPESLVLTDSDLVDGLVSVVKGDPKLPSKLTSTLHDPKQAVVFLGFQLHRFQLRVLMHVLNDGGKPQISYAQEIKDYDPGTQTFYGEGLQIRLFVSKGAEFVHGLVEDITGGDAAGGDAAGGDAPGEVGEHLGDRVPFFDPSEEPRVFLCHANEDKDQVRALARRLRRQGLNIWFDESDLSPGAAWRLEIESAIGDEELVSYFLVIESAAFLEARRREDKRFFNREIELALDRKSHLPTGTAFIIPVLIDEEAERRPDPEFKDKHRVSLNEREGFAKLLRVLAGDGTSVSAG